MIKHLLWCRRGAIISSRRPLSPFPDIQRRYFYEIIRNNPVPSPPSSSPTQLTRSQPRASIKRCLVFIAIIISAHMQQTAGKTKEISDCWEVVSRRLSLRYDIYGRLDSFHSTGFCTFLPHCPTQRLYPVQFVRFLISKSLWHNTTNNITVYKQDNNISHQ